MWCWTVVVKQSGYGTQCGCSGIVEQSRAYVVYYLLLFQVEEFK